jgi:hypothetical protein
MLAAARSACAVARATRRELSTLSLRCARAAPPRRPQRAALTRAHNPTRACSVTDEQRAAYERDGAICVRGAFGADWVERLREAGERNLGAPGPLVDEHVPPGEPGARAARRGARGAPWRRRSLRACCMPCAAAAAAPRCVLRGARIRVHGGTPYAVTRGTAVPGERAPRQHAARCWPFDKCPPPRTATGRFHDDQFLWRRHATFRDFVFDSQAAAVRAPCWPAQRTALPLALHTLTCAPPRSWRKP